MHSDHHNKIFLRPYILGALAAICVVLAFPAMANAKSIPCAKSIKETSVQVLESASSDIIGAQPKKGKQKESLSYVWDSDREGALFGSTAITISPRTPNKIRYELTQRYATCSKGKLKTFGKVASISSYQPFGNGGSVTIDEAGTAFSLTGSKATKAVAKGVWLVSTFKLYQNSSSKPYFSDRLAIPIYEAGLTP